jgi:hypothetical protein
VRRRREEVFCDEEARDGMAEGIGISMTLRELCKTLNAKLVDDQPPAKGTRLNLPLQRHHDLISIPGLSILSHDLELDEKGQFALWQIYVDEGWVHILGRLKVDPHGTQTYVDCFMALTTVPIA